MKIGDLVRLTGKCFTGIGYIKGFGQYGESYVLVGYISGDGFTKRTESFYPKGKLTLLKEVTNESR